MMKTTEKNKDIRAAMAAAEMKQSELAGLLGMGTDNFAHWLAYKERTAPEKLIVFKAIRSARMSPDQVLGTIRIQNLPRKGVNGWVVARPHGAQLWYYGTYDTEFRATEVAEQLGNGVVMEV